VKDIVKGVECATRIVGKHIRETGSAAENPVCARQSHFHTGAAALKSVGADGVCTLHKIECVMSYDERTHIQIRDWCHEVRVLELAAAASYDITN
jgi:hypothetical protein